MRISVGPAGPHQKKQSYNSTVKAAYYDPHWRRPPGAGVIVVAARQMK